MKVASTVDLNAIKDGDEIWVDDLPVQVIDACAAQCYVKTEAGSYYWVLHNSGRIKIA